MTYEDYLAEEDFLMHYGIKGQRWGIRRTPEQLGHYIQRKEEKISFYQKKANEARAKGNSKLYYKYLEKQKKTNRLIEKARSKMPKAQEREEKKEARHQAKLEKQAAQKAEEKEQFLRTASAEELMKRRGEFSDDEINRAIRRLQTTKQIADIEKQAKEDKFNSAISFADKAIKGFNKYEDVARVVNKITGSDTLTVFSDKGKKEYEALFKEINNSLDYSKIMANRDKLKPEDFNKALDTYHKAKGENRSKVMTALNQEITRATESVSDYTTRITTGQTQRTAAQTRKTTAEARHSAAQTALTTAEANITSAKSLVRTKETEVRTAKQEWKEAKRRADRMAATGNTSAAAALYSTAATKETAYHNKELELTTARGRLTTANTQRDSAKQAVERTKEQVDRANEELNQINERITNLENERNQATEFIRQRRREVWQIGSSENPGS